MCPLADASKLLERRSGRFAVSTVVTELVLLLGRFCVEASGRVLLSSLRLRMMVLDLLLHKREVPLVSAKSIPSPLL